MALDLLRRCRSMAFIEADFVVMGEGFCGDGEALEGFDTNAQPYLIGVPASEVVFARVPRPRGAWGHAGDPPGRDETALTVSNLCEMLLAEAWRTAQVRTPEGVDREDFALARVRSSLPAIGSRPLWLVVRNASRQDSASPRYYFSNAGPDTPLDQIAAALQRYDAAPVLFQEADRYLGLSQYETRSWDGWHHHVSLVALAYWLAASVGAGRSADLLQMPSPGLHPSGWEPVGTHGPDPAE
jgi:hypothetical protein